MTASNITSLLSCTGGSSHHNTTLIARFMGPTWGPSGADRTQVGHMFTPCTLLSGNCQQNPFYGWISLQSSTRHGYMIATVNWWKENGLQYFGASLTLQCKQMISFEMAIILLHKSLSLYISLSLYTKIIRNTPCSLFSCAGIFISLAPGRF